MTVRELETRMEASELNEWMAYWSLEPWGQVQADYRAGLITSMVLNAQGAKYKGRPFEPSDFFPLYGEKRGKTQTVEEQISIFKGLAHGNSTGVD